MPIAPIELQKQAAPSVTPAARPERRQKGRVKISREIRIRPADFSCGSFEEVRSTLNVSRNGFYFQTPHDRYHVGMRLRFAPAAEPGTEGDWGDKGDVVRVDRHGNGFGVAVVLTKPAERRGQTRPASADKRERRSAARQQFIASTEVIDVQTGMRSRMRTADLSTQGCYINTQNPLPLDATVRLQIEKENSTVEFRARVISSHQGSGMGLIFEGMAPEQRSVLAKWLGEQPAQPTASRDVLPQEEAGTESEGRFAESPRVLRLLDLMISKGIIREFEVSSLLREL
jgi:hypothetical protein